MKGKKLLILAATMLLGAAPIATLAACGSNPEPVVEVTGVSLNKNSLEVRVGDTETLVATVTPDNATSKVLTWTSSNPAIASVSDAGLVTAVAVGETTIKVECGSFSAECKVTVSAAFVAVESVSLNQSELTLPRKRAAAVLATVLPANATDPTVTWTSGNTAVATVDANGKITGVSAGETKITATAGSKSAELNVTVTSSTYTYNEYVTVSPSNWNELTYQDANDTEIIGFINGGFFNFDYKFDAEGNILPGEFEVEFDGATAIEDVTTEYAGDPKYDVPESATKNFAYKITLRDDLKWDTGEEIHAEDFVYTMEQQLDPLFQNYRADSYYKAGTVIHNAQNYLKQGQSNYFAARDAFAGQYSEDIDGDLIFDGFYGDEAEGADCSYIFTWFRGKNGSDYDNYLKNFGAFVVPLLYGMEISAAQARAMSAALDGKTLAEIKADATLKSYWDIIIGWWQTDPGEELDFFITHYTFPEVDFEDVGIFVGDNENELVLVLDKSLELLKEDGSLSYKSAYNMSSLPLVNKTLYEANKVEPALEDGLWTSRYNSSVASTASWGPYKLTYFQAGKQFILEINENWYGWNKPENAGLYQTDRIVCDTVADWNTAFLMFKQGDMAGIGIDVSVSQEYKNSQRARFTADDYVGSLQLQSSASALKERSTAEHNKMLLTYKDFRNAISLAIDRADFTNKCTTASLPGFGLFNSMHYYDVENGGVYRNEDVAKQTLCDAYGVNVLDYDSLDDAYKSITGYNLELARQLLTKAYNEAKEAGDITDTDIVLLTVGTAELTVGGQRQFDYLKAAFELLAVGTPLEGRLTLEYDTHYGSSWANDFRAGAYDICTGGWSGAPWDPGYFLGAYLDPANMYSQGWDTEHEMLTFNPYGDDEEEHTYTMSLMDWYNCLNGLEQDKVEFNWSEGEVDTEFRLTIIARLEKAVLEVYYTVPLYNYFSASLLSYKVEYISNDYHTFMGYGGLRYLRYNYDDASWEPIKGTFDYTK